MGLQIAHFPRALQEAFVAGLGALGTAGEAEHLGTSRMGLQLISLFCRDQMEAER